MPTSNNPFQAFLPWGRRGIAAHINEADTLGASNGTVNGRPTLNVTVRVTTDVDTSTQSIGLNIIGPGDIIGMNLDSIVRTEPRNWITNFEPHSFPFIDFYEEDFPWRYTPAKADASNKKLRPWFTLIVLKESEFTRTTVPNAPLTAITLNGTAVLPKHDQIWAWAHVSVNSSMDPTQSGSMSTIMGNLNQTLETNPNNAISRILCPRQLEENTSYYGFLIPTFETGRLAGLGTPEATINTTPAQKSSWTGTSSNATFPVYYEFYFRTGATGDFEYLVRQLKPRVLDQRVGFRLLDVQTPGYGITYTSGNGTLPLGGALLPTTSAGSTYPYSDTTFRNKLRDFINLGADMIDPSFYSNPSYNTTLGGSGTLADPVISAPLYGRWHALRRTVDSVYNTYWTNELNLHPSHRIAAGIGAEFVRKNQDTLMTEAWKQVGEVIAANNSVNWAQLNQQSGRAMHEQHIESQPAEQSVAMTSNVMGRVMSSNSSVSVQQDALASKLPEGAESSVFRRIRRPNGALMKRFDAAGYAFNNMLTNLSNGTAFTATAHTAPNAPLFTGNDLDSLMLNVASVTNPSVINAFNVTAPNMSITSPNPNVAIGFQAMLGDYNTVFNNSNWPTPGLPGSFDLNGSAATLSANTSPVQAIALNFNSQVSYIVNGNPIPPPPSNTIVPAMAGPSFCMPMYKSLIEMGKDYFVPNLELVPQNSVTLLQTNYKFIESFMVGANYEMARELLWREYPTDQRGTYFRHFWDTSDRIDPNLTPQQLEIATRDIYDIALWTNSNTLGTNGPRRSQNPPQNDLILCIRGDFLKKFPNAIIYAAQAAAPLTGQSHKSLKTGVDPKFPLYSAKVDPDITFLGFDLTVAEAKGPTTAYPYGWYFVITERPGDLRFGIDTDPTATTSTVIADWNQLSWQSLGVAPGGYVDLTAAVPNTANTNANLASPTFNAKLPPTTSNPTKIYWQSDSAAMAMITYQTPMMMLIHANVMIP